jgi:hypothetical protein
MAALAASSGTSALASVAPSGVAGLDGGVGAVADASGSPADCVADCVT